MRKLFLLLFTTLFLTSLNAQEQNWIMQSRVLNVDAEDVQKFESAVAKKTKMYNSKEGTARWLTFRILTGPNTNNYVRAQGYVEDGSGTGDKDKDTMLAQLADGEFVTRADGVLGAGIIAGANPESFKDMREKGASYFYEQQKRYKRVFDLLQGSRDAKAKVN